MENVTAMMTTNRDKNLPSDKVGVVFYGRASTQHEAQVNALDSQMLWYHELLKTHPSWVYLAEFVDAGISGTVAKKRNGFQEMIKYAEEHRDKVNLIVTREVCRFARNTVDSLTYVRQLKAIGIEVYFYNDNIWSMDSDGELRLTIMSALAQEESRKVSERVKSGQETSRKKGVLYGSGNLLGYKLIRKGQYNSNGEMCHENTYEIIPEDADTVRLIYSLYVCDNMGAKKIANRLTELKRKNASGKIKWDMSNVMRILHNRTYCGFICYNKSVTVDYLNHKRVVNRDASSYQYIKGNFPAIVSDEDWQEAQRISKRRCNRIVDGRKHGKPEIKDRWGKVLICSCGHRFERHHWRTNKNTQEKVYGYNCYNVKRNRKKQFRDDLGLDTDEFCDCPSIPEWKLDYMLKNILTKIWKQPWRTVKKLYTIIEDNYQHDTALTIQSSTQTDILKKEHERMKGRLDTLLMMRLDGKLSDELFCKNQKELEKTIRDIERKLEEQGEQVMQEDCPKESLDTKKEKLDVIKRTLKECANIQAKSIDNRLVEQLVERVVPCEQATVFKYYLNLLGDKDNEFTTDNYFLYDTITLGFEEARKYRKEMGSFLRTNQWKDLTVEVYMKV